MFQNFGGTSLIVFQAVANDIVNLKRKVEQHSLPPVDKGLFYSFAQFMVQIGVLPNLSFLLVLDFQKWYNALK